MIDMYTEKEGYEMKKLYEEENYTYNDIQKHFRENYDKNPSHSTISKKVKRDYPKFEENTEETHPNEGKNTNEKTGKNTEETKETEETEEPSILTVDDIETDQKTETKEENKEGKELEKIENYNFDSKKQAKKAKIAYERGAKYIDPETLELYDKNKEVFEMKKEG